MNLQKNKLILYSLILGFLGFLVATYLTILHFRHIIPTCSVTGNCEAVLTSRFATIGPIPLALLGSLFYLAVMVICILILTNYRKIFVDFFHMVAAVGFMVSVVLLLIQAYILHAFCQYCLLSEAISTGIIILAYLDFRQRKALDKATKK
jgi:uncharacterized membrane protein